MINTKMILSETYKGAYDSLIKKKKQHLWGHFIEKFLVEIVMWAPLLH